MNSDTPVIQSENFSTSIEVSDKNKNETIIGRYNSKTFSFSNLSVIPNILFDSMAIWVDESENKVYLIYGEYRNYQLLSFPPLK